MPFRNRFVGTLLPAIWHNRWRVGLVTLAFMLSGVAVALLLPEEFVSEARIIPEMTNGSGSVVKRLASVAGIGGLDFSDADDVDAVRPDLYPNILQSTPFLLYLINQRIKRQTGQATTVGEFLLPDTGVGWSWRQWLSSGRQLNRSANQNGLLQLTPRQRDIADDISGRLNTRLDTRSGIITISARMPDPLVAATVTQRAMTYLTRYVTEYRTGKARHDLRFCEQQLQTARQRYRDAQYALFMHNDRHKNVVLQTATIEKHRLDTELVLAQSVYNQLAQQREQIKLRVQERTPIFKTLEPPTIPHQRVSPKRTILVVLFTAVGLTIGSLMALLNQQPWDVLWQTFLKNN
ncbi:hypothetical protein AWR27_15315 [Spirosoma montaniterrae]|uniref:Polysaccharide chain length determinant N-terminal domain-containing protein n=1 Tax=Spirosoma montaniterrae TaxID=1178516 RepID=A0A1P9X4E9_9BACT|nr:hypothetical protein AWR27_15315 [Spirosoma montaniterrae]